MTLFFNRDFELNAGGLRNDTFSQDDKRTKPTLRIQFSIEKTGQQEPNSAEISITNLSDESRKFLQAQTDITTTLQVGYSGNLFQIFAGNLNNTSSQRQGTDWVTTMQAKDGSKAYREARVNESFLSGVSITDVAKKIAQSFVGKGVGLGNLEQALASGNIRGAIDKFDIGKVVSGAARVEFDKIMKTMGLEWSIQDGQLQVLTPTGAVDNTVVLLRPESGLIGAPELGEKNVLKARSLLQPDLTPGKIVTMQSAAVTGNYKITRSTYVGDTWGQDWYVDIEGKPLR